MKRFVRKLKKAIASALNVLKGTDKTTQEKETVARQKGETGKRMAGIANQLERYLGAHYLFRYNVLTEETEMARKNGKESLKFNPVGQRTLNSISLDAQKAGVNCWDRDVQRYVYSEKAMEYHPFKEYFKDLPAWDGVDRVTAFAQRVSDEQVWVKYFHRWMRAATSQYMGRSTTANCLIPILVSTEQGWGKSTFCRMLLPPELQRYYTENLDLGNASAATMKLGELGMVNLDEFDKLTDRRIATLKNLAQATELTGRRSFHRYWESLYRLASFIATSNRRDLLVDKSGSRRFLCIELTHPIDNQTPIDYPQLYAQLKAEVEAGEPTWFTKKEEAELQTHNLGFYRISVEEEVFYRCFRFAESNEKGAETLTAAEIFEVMQKAYPKALRGITSYAFSRMLPSMGKRIHGKQANGYCVVRL